MARRDSKRIDEPEDPPGQELVIPERPSEQMLAEQLVARAREEGIDLVGPDGFLTTHHQVGPRGGPGRGDDRSSRLRGPRSDRSRFGQLAQRHHPQDGPHRRRTGDHRGAARPRRRLRTGHRAQAPAPPRRLQRVDHLALRQGPHHRRDRRSPATRSTAPRSRATPSVASPTPSTPRSPSGRTDRSTGSIPWSSSTPSWSRSATGRSPIAPSTWPWRITMEGERDVLGLWVGTGGEGAKHWLERADRTEEPRRRRRLHRLLRRTERDYPKRSPPSGRAPTSRPASCTWCATPCATPRDRTGPRSRPTCAASTPRRRSTPRPNASRSSKRSGERLSRGHPTLARRLGRVHSVPQLPVRGALDDLHHQHHRIAQRALSKVDPSARSLPERAVGHQGALSHHSPNRRPRRQRRRHRAKLEEHAQHAGPALRRSHQPIRTITSLTQKIGQTPTRIE